MAGTIAQATDSVETKDSSNSSVNKFEPSGSTSSSARPKIDTNSIDASSDGKENLTAIRGGVVGNVNSDKNSNSGSRRIGERLSRSTSLQLRQQRQQQQSSRQEVEISDGDELVDSESERAELEEIEKRKQSRLKEAKFGPSGGKGKEISTETTFPKSLPGETTTGVSSSSMHALLQKSRFSPPNVSVAAREGDTVSMTSTVDTPSAPPPAVKPGRGRPRGRGRGASKATDGRAQAQASSVSMQYSPLESTPKSYTASSLVDSNRPSQSFHRGSAQSIPHASPSLSQSAAAATTIVSHPKAPYPPYQSQPPPPPPSSSSSIAPVSRDSTATTVKNEKYPPPFRPQPPPNVPSPHSIANDHIARKMQQSTSYKNDSAPKPKLEDLTYQEVDKFMDLIEKHNLHTSNEDEMARSVTELYQEWLEWCAKRNVSSTKSKQALVAEFVRIHQGDYGLERQQRAVEIVKGSGVDDMDGDAIDPHTGRDRPRRGSALLQPSSLPTAPSPGPTNVPNHHKKVYKDDEREVTMHDRSGHATTIRDHPAQTPSPIVVSKALPPSAAVLESAQTTSNTQRESLYWQLRDDLWRDAGSMISRVVTDQIGEVLTENASLRGRVEQLETHSDNLAQWIQHLNRVQDDFSQTLATPPSRTIREEVIMEDKYGHPHSSVNHQSSRSVMAHPNERLYGPSYPGPSSPHSSPKRSYVIHRSPSPQHAMRHSGYPPASHSAPIVYRASSRERYAYNGGGGGGGGGREGGGGAGGGGGPPSTQYSHRITSADHYDRQSPYYAYPPDARDRDRERDRLPVLPASSPHHAPVKRPRNGY